MADKGTLIIFRKQLGDVLLLQPALERLALERGPVSVYARDGFADLLALMPGDIQLDTGSLLPRYSDVFCLEARPAAMLYAARVLGARKHLLLSRDVAPWWQRLIFDRYEVVSGSNCYRADLYQQLLCGIGSDFQLPRLNLPPESWYPAGLPATYAVLHPTAAWQSKTWPAAHWVALLKELDPGLPWVLTAGNASWEKALAEEIVAGLAGKVTVLNLAGKTSLAGFLAVMAKSAITLCIDGSASHLSAAFGHPTLTLFGATSATRWHRASAISRCLKAGDFLDQRKPPVSAIPVAAVLAEARDLFAFLP
jgi:ADP-heptose:LPS heptosyltransferase